MLGKIEEGDLLCEHCQTQLDNLVAAGLVLPEEIVTLRQPRRALTVHIPLRRDSGETTLVPGFRIQYNDALGPTKGGIRIHERADLDDVTELAFLMSLKTALVGLPYGGAKGAIKINPAMLSDAEYERVVRGYIRDIARFIGPDRDIPAPDVNTNADTMALMLDEYERVVGEKSPAAFTGKPFALGGSLGRDTATSRGGFSIIRKVCAGRDPREVSVAVQGFGNVGSHLARMLFEAGFRVVAVSDSSGGVYNPGGLDIAEATRFKSAASSGSARRRENLFSNYENGDARITNDELLALGVDVLAPAALGGVIVAGNAPRVRAATIVEMANAPVTPEAEAILRERGVVVVPDILANAGGVIVSYFEWVQNRADEQWTAEKVGAKLEETIIEAYERVVVEAARRPHLSLRTVAYLLAVRKILDAERKR